MPIAVETQTKTETIPALKLRLKAEGAPAVKLRDFSHFDSTPSIGTEFRAHSVNGKGVLSIRDVMKDDDKLKQLALLVSERGVVFFRDAEITPEEQKTLVDKLGKFGGKPADSGLHIHPLTLEGSELGDEISVISNEFVFDKKVERRDDSILSRPKGALLWHSDITFENVPSDYASLQIRTFPSVGGDTLWASAYEAYDRLSPAYQKFLEGLTATHTGQGFIDLVKDRGIKFRENRGSPHNVGQDLSTSHPVIRTNPVTGWKGIFVNKGFTKKINELTKEESDRTLDFLFDHIASNHDIQVRFRWEPNSLSIWDNRSTFHAATYDLDKERRIGTRSVSLGERPHFDPNSISRRTDLAEQAEKAAGGKKEEGPIEADELVKNTLPIKAA